MEFANYDNQFELQSSPALVEGDDHESTVDVVLLNISGEVAFGPECFQKIISIAAVKHRYMETRPELAEVRLLHGTAEPSEDVLLQQLQDEYSTGILQFTAIAQYGSFQEVFYEAFQNCRHFPSIHQLQMCKHAQDSLRGAITCGQAYDASDSDDNSQLLVTACLLLLRDLLGLMDELLSEEEPSILPSRAEHVRAGIREIGYAMHNVPGMVDNPSLIKKVLQSDCRCALKHEVLLSTATVAALRLLADD